MGKSEAMVSVGRLSLGNRSPIQNVVDQNQQIHTSVSTALNVAPTVSARRAFPMTRAEGSTSNAHTSQATHPVAPTVGAPRAYHATRAAASTATAPRPQPVARTGRGSNNAHNAQITHPVEPTVSAPRAYPAAIAERGNAQTAQVTYPATASNHLPDQYEEYWEDTPVEYASEGSTVYVGNLPYHIDDESLALSFEHAGVVVFSEVIYDDKTGQSRGFGHVTMSALQEAEKAVRMYHRYVIYGSVRPLTVYITAPRQSGSPFEIFVCNLPWQVDDSWLEKLFSAHDEVVDARVVYYERRGGTRCSREFGFVTMATEEQSYYVINSLNKHPSKKSLNKQILEGHTLRVKVSRESPQQGY